MCGGSPGSNYEISGLSWEEVVQLVAVVYGVHLRVVNDIEVDINLVVLDPIDICCVVPTQQGRALRQFTLLHYDFKFE